MNHLLNKRSISIKIPYDEHIKIIFNKKTSKTINQPDFNLDIYKIINKYKTYIDKYKEWDKYKSYSNLFEIITYNSYCKFQKPLTLYEPISRAYFKFWEILINFNLINPNNSNYKYAALAEGPGGFVECFINYRKKCFQGKFDKIYCMTLLNSDTYNVPDWKKISKFLSRKRNNINILYGEDGTGNLYNIENIKYFIKNSGKNKMDLVTADGGFDYSNDFDKQEQLSYRLIFCEIVTALALTKKGGHFILKIFDIFTTLTLKFIFLLNNYYEEVIITKPYISRPANSEKYIVCKNFIKPLSDTNLNKYFNIIKNWNDKTYIIDLFTFEVPLWYKKVISMYNYYNSKKQVENILQTLFLINNKISESDKTNIIIKQTVYSLLWCEKYKQNINFKSNFLKYIKY